MLSVAPAEMTRPRTPALWRICGICAVWPATSTFQTMTGSSAQVLLQPAFAQVQLAHEPFAAGGQFPGAGVEGPGLDDARLHQPLDGLQLVGMAAEIFADIEGVFHGEAVAGHRFRQLDRLGEGLDVGGEADFRRVAPTEVGVGVRDDQAAIAEHLLAARDRDVSLNPRYPLTSLLPLIRSLSKTTGRSRSDSVIWACCSSGDSATATLIPTAPAA